MVDVTTKAVASALLENIQNKQQKGFADPEARKILGRFLATAGV